MPQHPLLEEQVEEAFGIEVAGVEQLDVPVNDVVRITAPAGCFALKIYHGKRTAQDVEWEAGLVRHLTAHGAPVAPLVRGRHGYVEQVDVDGRPRAATLAEWAPGDKPTRGRATYLLLGHAAARIHAAGDSFSSPLTRTRYDVTVLIDEQLERMEPHLREARRWEQARELGARLRRFVESQDLDWGVCHMDLTLDNVHVHEGTLTVFDLDSAGECWRAIEPHGVLRSSVRDFGDWLEGYRSVRPFGETDARAVHAFTIIGDLRVVAWKLGVAESSRGKPLLAAAELPRVVDDWLALERAIPAIA
jgi:Ser/Thr protein kinase RdoA (MazF antagonist)